MYNQIISHTKYHIWCSVEFCQVIYNSEHVIIASQACQAMNLENGPLITGISGWSSRLLGKLPIFLRHKFVKKNRKITTYNWMDLGDVYTMDHESFEGPVKCVIGRWTRHGTTSVYTKEKMLEWPWSSRSPKDIF